MGGKINFSAYSMGVEKAGLTHLEEVFPLIVSPVRGIQC